MKPLTKEELRALDARVADGEEVIVWEVFPYGTSEIRKLTMVAKTFFYLDDIPCTVVDFTLEEVSYPTFTNYWHAYAHSLKMSGGR